MHEGQKSGAFACFILFFFLCIFNVNLSVINVICSLLCIHIVYIETTHAHTYS